MKLQKGTVIVGDEDGSGGPSLGDAIDLLSDKSDANVTAHNNVASDWQSLW